jgi:hypothetical protein
MLILNRTNKSLFLVLSLLVSSLQAAQQAALPGTGTGATQVGRELHLRLPAQREEESPLPNWPGRLVYSGLFGGFAGMTAWHVLTTQSGFGAVSVATTAAQRFFPPIDPLNACLGGSVVVGAGVGVAIFMRLGSLVKAAEKNKKEHNALVAEVEQYGPRLNQMGVALRLLQLEQNVSREAQRLHNARLDEVADDVGNLRREMRNGFANVANQAATHQEQTRNQFTQADQARAADTQRLHDQAAANHQKIEENQRKLLEEQRATQQRLEQLMALADRQMQRALTHQDGGAAVEGQPTRAIMYHRPGVLLRVQQRSRPAGFRVLLFPEDEDN